MKREFHDLKMLKKSFARLLVNLAVFIQNGNFDCLESKLKLNCYLKIRYLYKERNPFFTSKMKRRFKWFRYLCLIDIVLLTN